MNQKDFEKQVNIIRPMFTDFLEEKGFNVFVYDDKYLGIGATASKNDRFVPIINLCCWSYPRRYSIHVEDRNGNDILNGNTVAVYLMDLDGIDNIDDNKLKKRFNEMLNDVYGNYGIYSKENKLDSAYKELAVERKNYLYLKDNEATPILNIDGEDLYLSARIDAKNKLSLCLIKGNGERYINLTDKEQLPQLKKEIVFLYNDLPNDLYQLLQNKGLYKLTGLYIPNKPLLVTINKEIIKEYAPNNYHDCFADEIEKEKMER